MCARSVCQENSSSCVNSAFVDGWWEVEIAQDGQVAVTRQNRDAADTERVNGITDLVEAGGIVAIAAADDACFDYYLLKVSGPNTIDNYGAVYQKGSFILEGNFFLRDNIIDMTYMYKLDKRKAIVYANTVRAICGELTMIRRQRKELFKLSLAQHEEIMSVF